MMALQTCQDIQLSGVAANIQKEEEPAIYVHCLAHCTNLCLQTTESQLVPMRDALFLVQEINQLIHFLSKGSSLFEDMQADLSP